MDRSARGWVSIESITYCASSRSASSSTATPDSLLMSTLKLPVPRLEWYASVLSAIAAAVLLAVASFGCATARLGLGVVTLVCVDDLPDQLVPHHVLACQPGEVNVREAVEYLLHHAQAAHLAVGQVDLGDVSGDHDLRAESEAGEEHLHLLARGVLRLVQDDERVVEAPAPHVSERGYLDRARGHELGDRVGVDHVVQGVVERAQVRVDLLVEGARQKTEPLPRLDGWPGKDDPVDLLGLQCLHRLGHGEVRLARACRADGEHDRVPVDRVGVVLLVQRLRPD